MSNLKHMNLGELRDARALCHRKINHHLTIAEGQRIRLNWINKYIQRLTDIGMGKLYRGVLPNVK